MMLYMYQWAHPWPYRGRYFIETNTFNPSTGSGASGGGVGGSARAKTGAKKKKSKNAALAALLENPNGSGGKVRQRPKKRR